MTNKRIPDLTAATTPLAGTELVPVWDGAGTKKVTVDNLTAGKAVSALSYSATTTITATYGIYAKVENQALGITDAQTLYRGTPDGTGFEHAKIVATRDATTFTYGSQLDFYTEGKNTGTTDTSTAKWTLNSAGNLVARIAGKGIDFSAVTPAAGMTSKVLTNYEEGTWTPNQGSGLTVVGAFSSTGTYTRIGRQVTLSGELNGATSIACSGGQPMFTNAPFTGSAIGTGTAANNAITQSVGTVYGGLILYAAGNLAATTNIYFSVTYFV